MKKLIFITFVLFSFVSYAQMKHRIVDNIIVQSEGLGNLTSLSYTYDNGWRGEVIPMYNDTFQILSTRYYNQAMDAVTWVVIDKELPDINELKSEKIEELNNAINDLFTEINNYIIYSYVAGIQIPQSHKDEIVDIITKKSIIESNINSITTKTDVIRFKIPYDQINTKREALKTIMQSL